MERSAPAMSSTSTASASPFSTAMCNAVCCRYKVKQNGIQVCPDKVHFYESPNPSKSNVCNSNVMNLQYICFSRCYLFINNFHTFGQWIGGHFISNNFTALCYCSEAEGDEMWHLPVNFGMLSAPGWVHFWVHLMYWKKKLLKLHSTTHHPKVE